MSEEQIEISHDESFEGERFSDLNNSLNESEKYLELVNVLKEKVRTCYVKEKERREENKTRFSKCVDDINNVTRDARRIDDNFKDTMRKYTTDDSDLLKPKSLLLTIISYFFVIVVVIILVKFMQSYGAHMANKRNFDPRLPPPA